MVKITGNAKLSISRHGFPLVISITFDIIFLLRYVIVLHYITESIKKQELLFLSFYGKIKIRNKKKLERKERRMNPKYTKKIVALILLLSLLFVPSCGKRQKEYETTCFEYFDTFSTLTVYTNNKEDFEKYSDTFQSMLKEYHELLDIYHEYDRITNLKTINDSNSAVTVDPKLGEFLKFGKEMYNLTDGYTNIAMGSVLSLWRTARENEKLPSKRALEEANKHVNINDLQISEDGTLIQKNDPELRIDAGAIGKGFVAEKIAKEVEAMGCKSFLLNLGGNTVAHGTKPKDEPYLAGIENPTEGEGLRGSVELSGYALVTSGSYQRYFTVNETKYHHIIHPKTLYPENYCLSVSVLCPDSGVADALSTALFSMSVEDGMELLKKRDDVEVIWLFPDGSTKMTDGFMDHVKTEK